ncbi:hypothetical protein PAXRUDRAFT_830825 [Paxillus rubicundulus Ve08.2h10]|uniref:Uncharacterized protein n=1 Tax=Paxillus rubicundulus Ve08.2h10 TaxID=930991 RepID=A0A0D0DSZ2_9AGAM|nr:hypothetical protein PAXRUDRAFT_830825 [Paxillus rubicundulus Ve08.2h10]
MTEEHAMNRHSQGRQGYRWLSLHEHFSEPQSTKWSNPVAYEYLSNCDNSNHNVMLEEGICHICTRVFVLCTCWAGW